MNAPTNNKKGNKAQMKAQTTKSKVYRLAYPCSIYFDIEADNYNEAAEKGVDFLRDISAGLAQDIEKDDVMVYPTVNHHGEPMKGDITLDDVTESEAI